MRTRDRPRARDAKLLDDQLFGARRDDLREALFESARDERGMRLNQDGRGGRQDGEEGQQRGVGGPFGIPQAAVIEGSDEASPEQPQKGPQVQPHRVSIAGRPFSRGVARDGG